MRNIQPRINLAVGVVQVVSAAVLVCAMMFGLITQKPWWLVLAPALALPELTLGAIATLRGLRPGPRVSSTGGSRATRALATAGVALILCGLVFWS